MQWYMRVELLAFLGCSVTDFRNGKLKPELHETRALPLALKTSYIIV